MNREPMNREPMAFRVPLSEHPDHHFIYEEDLSPLSLKDVARLVLFGIASVVVAVVMWVFAFLVALV